MRHPTRLLVLVFLIPLLAGAACRASATVAPTPNAEATQAVIEARVLARLTAAVTETASPTGTAVAPSASPSPTPSSTVLPSPTSSVQLLWVNADLAFGYERPDPLSRVVFQVSRRDGWKVTVIERWGQWLRVRAGTAEGWMSATVLSDEPPPTAAPTARPSLTPVPPPTLPPAPTFANVRVGAICNDGTTSGATGSGACSHHGGVRQWIYR